MPSVRWPGALPLPCVHLFVPTLLGAAPDVTRLVSAQDYATKWIASLGMVLVYWGDHKLAAS